MRTKWWYSGRYQEVVDYFRDLICFVQVGSKDDYHPRLKNVIDLVGETSIRDLVSLVYSCDGALTPTSFLMHLTAAVRNTDGALKPCVVVNGGREASHWEAYPGHQFLHTIGALHCCQSGGCWKSHVPSGDNSVDGGSMVDSEQNCSNVFNGYPKCMDLISVDHVVSAIELFLSKDSH
jgi:ADP-heptose:LPS heptosyltransferase